MTTNLLAQLSVKQTQTHGCNPWENWGLGSATEQASSPLKKPPGEGTGPTMHADFRGNLVGRVPSRGERAVFQQTASWRAKSSCRPL